ncbi:MAG: ABC-2 type transport system ATP-binding protein [Saprospiraceae bacterium]|jgi:ABC-2 type transport system ATP-binding protein
MSTAINIENLRKTYANGFEALKGIDLKIESGDFFALLGPNGAGKSTTIGILCSLVNKSSGKINIYDADIDVNFPLAKSYLGVVPQEVNFSVFEHPMQIVMQQAGFYGLTADVAEERAEKYLKQLGLWEKRFSISRTLSGGQKRRLMIARALIHHPKILILDEPTAGVDIEIRRTMWAFLKEINEAGTTIVLTTHYLEEAENLCRNIAIIDRGNVVHNSSMKQLLKGLQKETYVLDVEGDIGSIEHSPHTIRSTGEGNLEVDLPKNETLNEVFEWLSSKNIMVSSMRSKSNRLEQLFIDLVSEETAS